MINKRILFICSPFFGYYKHIMTEFEHLGYEVDYYNDRPTENAIVKGLIKIKKNLVNKLIKRYFKKILDETSSIKYDKVIIVNGKIFNKEIILSLKKQQKHAEFIFYTWDSIELYPNVKEFLSEFNRCYSFDLKDCENIKELKFLPLFYTKPYEIIGYCNNEKNINYDILSICTVHPNRYTIITSLFPNLESKGIRIYSFMFLNKLQFIYNKIFVKEFKKSKIKEFSFKPLSEEQILKYINKSKIIFDIPHNKQSGLTMRTIESLGAKKKLITTNSDIKKYDFYDENNIFIIENNNLNKIEDFIKNEYRNKNNEIYRKYSISNWSYTIINNSNNKYLK